MNIVGERRTRIWLLTLVTCLSLGFGVLGIVWLLDGGSFPFGPTAEGRKLSLLAYLPPRVGAGAVAVLGFLGVPAAIGHARTEWSLSAYRPLLAFTAVQVVLFGLLAPNITVVVLVGYLLVLVGLPVAAVWLAIGAWRQPATRVALLAIVLVVAGLEVGVGLFDWSALRGLATGLADVPQRVGLRPLFVFASFVLGIGWAVLGVQGFRSAQGRRGQCGDCQVPQLT